MEFITPDFSLFIWQVLLPLSVGLWIYCLVDILRNNFVQNEKIIWLLTVLVVPFIGSVLYLLIGQKKKLKLN